ncbi:hypothetical protein [Tatumella sp. OPLPL6]|uniref:hypothetical protein n=1 Tax=Tatumella sp. OPLPL6 TaxID=1928657 RepID=UPI000C1934C2|nr:hypothetical protein [Tatumella sp. OPLPL6]PIJ43357.1 hypothetical protein BOM24_09335 [Tatumella sp. OPLPL6]
MRKLIKQALSRLIGRNKHKTVESELSRRINMLVADKQTPTTTVDTNQEPAVETAPEPVVYELPVVPVIKRKSKTRATAKSIRKSRKRITRKGKK